MMEVDDICLKYPIQNGEWILSKDIFISYWNNGNFNGESSRLKFVKSKNLNLSVLDPWNRNFKSQLKLRTDVFSPVGDGKTLSTYINVTTTVDGNVVRCVYILE